MCGTSYASPDGLAPLASEPLCVSSRPSEPFGLLGERRNRIAVSPSMFTVADNHKPGYSNQVRMFHCGRAIYRAHLIIAPGMGAVMRRRRRACFSVRRRRPKEAPRPGGRGQAQAQPAQKAASRQAAFERTARPQGERSESRLVKALRCERM